MLYPPVPIRDKTRPALEPRSAFSYEAYALTPVSKIIHWKRAPFVVLRVFSKEYGILCEMRAGPVLVSEFWISFILKAS
jgi:hypothetical protein